MKKTWLIPLLLAALAGIVGFGLTGEKAQKVQKINRGSVGTMNPGCKEEALNPLRKDAYPLVSRTVREYYRELGDARNFIEGYEDVQVYTKSGKYTGSYVVFVKYGMKIKDIYTKVPGLGTLYIEKNGTSGAYEIKSELTEEMKSYVALVSAHEDVQALLSETNEEYEAALQSDALLAEELLDLKNAYEEQSGSR